MEFLQKLVNALSVELFTVGGQVVSPFRLGGTVVVFMMTWCIAVWVGSLCRRRFRQTMEGASRYTMIRLVQYGIWAAGILLLLRVWNIDLTGLAVAAGVLGVGLGFGLQSLIANFVAGIVLLLERPIRINDFVTSEEVEGRVEEISFRYTKIVTNDNITIIVPNAGFTSRTVINWSHGDPRVRLSIPISVAYGSDVEAVRDALLEVAEAEPEVLGDPEPRVRFLSFGDSALDFELLVWTDDPIHHKDLRSHLNYRIDAVFRSHGIEIPFPQRDLHVKSWHALQPPVES